jgi:hypothetical protein
VLWEGISIVELLGVKEQAANLNSSWALFGFLLCPDESRDKQFEEEKLKGVGDKPERADLHPTALEV